MFPLGKFESKGVVGGFLQVANKVVELLMVNAGQEVCCQSADDARRLEEFGTAQSRLDSM